jgi:hypothetical protein
MFQVAQNASFKCLSPSYCPEGGVHKVAGLGNAAIFTPPGHGKSSKTAMNQNWKKRKPEHDTRRPVAREAPADKGAGWASVAPAGHRRPSPPPRRSPSHGRPSPPPRRSPSSSPPPWRSSSSSPPRRRSGDRARSRTRSHHQERVPHRSHPKHNRRHDSRQDRKLPAIPGLHRSHSPSARPATLLSREFTPQQDSASHSQRHSRQNTARDSQSKDWETVERRQRSRKRSPSRDERRH